MGLVQFTLICFIFYYILQINYHPLFFPTMHTTLYLCSKVLITLLVPVYLLSICLQPGTVTKQFDFLMLANKLVTKGYHLENLCVYDEVLKTETSFHC